jgi:hypothetical protein
MSTDDRGLQFAEAWLRLLAEAARGTRAAQGTLRGLAEGQLTPEKLAQRIAGWLPAGIAPPSAEKLMQWSEDMWATIGVVPRSRYVELLERYEALRARLEEAEVTIRRLKRLLSEKGHEGDAQKLLDLWSSTVGETLKSQAEWMRGWIGGVGEGRDEGPEAAKPGTTRRRRRRSEGE